MIPRYAYAAAISRYRPARVTALWTHSPKKRSRSVCTLLRKEIVMVKVRIKGGTPEEGVTLCVSCSWGLVRRGSSAAEEEIVCRATTPAGRVPFRIRECSAYADSRLPTLYSMEKIAWVLLTKSAG